MTLQDAYHQLLRHQYPRFSPVEELAEWQMDLLDLDGFVAGIAQSVLGSCPMEYPDVLSQVEELRSQLYLINVEGKDRDIYAACCERIEMLREVARLLMEQA